MNRLQVGQQKLARFLFRGGRASRGTGSPAHPPAIKRRQKAAHRESRADEWLAVNSRQEPVVAVRQIEVPAIAAGERSGLPTTRFLKSRMTDSTGFIRALHYSGLTGAARVRVGLYRHGELVGVAVFSHPCSDAVLTRTLPKYPDEEVICGFGSSSPR